MLRLSLSLIAALLAITAYRGQNAIKNNILTLSAFPTSYSPVGPCKTLYVPDLKFCEDATFWDILDAQGKLDHRRVVMSCDPGRRDWNTVMGPLRHPEPHGALWTYVPSLKNAVPQRVELVGYPPGHDFHPLGVELWPSRGGESSVMFVVNHARKRSTIEQFTMEFGSASAKPRAKWVRTLESPYIVSPNAIALTSPTSFYVSNDHFMTRRIPYLGHILPLVETYLALPLGWVSHFTVESNPGNPSAAPSITHSFAALGINFANGIAISPSGNQFAVASSALGKILFYNRSPDTNALSYDTSVEIPFSTDNINFDEHGSLIVAGHPNFPALVAVVKDKQSAVAPSWIMSISPRTEGDNVNTTLPFDISAPISASTKVPASRTHDLETLYQSDGRAFGSSCTGLRDSTTGTLYGVGLYERGLLICQPS